MRRLACGILTLLDDDDDDDVGDRPQGGRSLQQLGGGRRAHLKTVSPLSAI